MSPSDYLWMTPEEVRDVVAAHADRERLRARRELSCALLIVNHIRPFYEADALSVEELLGEGDSQGEADEDAPLTPEEFKQLSQQLDDGRLACR